MFRTILLGISLVVSPSLFCWVATEWGLQWMIGILLLTFSLTLVIAIWLFPLIPEHQVAVVFVREDQSFARLLPGPRRQFVFTYLEQIVAHLNTAPDVVSATTMDVQASDGIPYRVEWALPFELAPLSIPRGMCAKLIRMLIQNPHRLVTVHVEDCLRLVLGKYPASELSRARNRRRLANELRDEIHARLQPFGIHVYRIMLGAMTPPHSYQDALNQAQQAEIQSQSQTNALHRLQQTVSSYSENDVKRLVEFEGLGILRENGAVIVYPFPSVLDGQLNINTLKSLNKNNGHGENGRNSVRQSYTANMPDPEI